VTLTFIFGTIDNFFKLNKFKNRIKSKIKKIKKNNEVIHDIYYSHVINYLNLVKKLIKSKFTKIKTLMNAK